MRLFGIGFLSLIPVLWGAWRREAIRKEGRLHAAAIRFFEHLKLEIEAFSRAQDAIFRDFQDPDLEKNGFLPRLRGEVERNPCGALGRALEGFSAGGWFSSREREALREFSAYFGMQSKDAQLKDCEKLLIVLRTREEKEQEKRKADASIAWTTGLCAGLGLFILLI